jgi:hypothetical protein
MTTKPILQSIDPPVSTCTYAYPPDPYDLETLALSQDFTETVGVKRVLTTVPVRRPNPQDFNRVHPSPDYRRNFLCVDLKDDRETYVVRPEIAAQLIGETVMKTVFTAINRQGVISLWPVVIPPPDSKSNPWWQSSREAAELAITRWVRIRADMSLGAYQIYEAQGELPDPEWPDSSYQELIQIGFRNRLVDHADHPVVRRLRGLV